MNHISKLIPFGIVVAGIVASNSAMAVTRTCESLITFHAAKKGSADDYYTHRDTSNVTGSAGTVFLARKAARRNLGNIFNNEWANLSGPEVTELMKKLPKGEYNYSATLAIYQESGYGCADGENKRGTFVK